MRPALVAAFGKVFISEWNRMSAEASARTEAARRELAAVERKLDNLVDAIAEGLKARGVQRKLDELEARRAELASSLAEVPAALPAIHPNVAEVYAKRVADLQQALDVKAEPEVVEAARALVDKVVINPGQRPDDPPDIELVGRVMAMLKAGGAFPNEDDAKNGCLVEAISSGSDKEDIGGVLSPDLQATSNNPAAPCPPPTHIVTTTNFAPRFFPSISACPAMRAPDMP